MNEKLDQLREKEAKMSAKDFLNEREIKVQNRNSVLHSHNVNFLKVALLGYKNQQTPEANKRAEQM